MQHPYQCISACLRASLSCQDILLAASGHYLSTFDLTNGRVIAIWPSDPSSKEDEEASNSSTEIITASAENELPAKKRRRVARKRARNQAEFSAPITKLCVSKDCRYVVATTGEDKSVHVFALDQAGSIEHLSQRRMPKRPCAVTLTSHDDTILCGDKFGDVYGLPLHPPEADDSPGPEPVHNIEKAVPKPAMPSATNLTVHTGKNRKTLEAQLKARQGSKPKESIDFAHELLLGHVSMLTDIVTVTIDVAKGLSKRTSELHKPRSYILTADRDEHIRSSRGRPQTHIIENYCFGHTQFVNKLCLPHQGILISGGGDDYLFVWDWLNSKLLCKLNLRNAMQQLSDLQEQRLSPFQVVPGEAMEQSNQPYNLNNGDDTALAVSGLWSLPDSGIAVLCACEGVPALFKFVTRNIAISSADDFEMTILPLEGNPLDIAVFQGFFLVSIDNVHEPGSTTSVQKETTSVVRVQSFAYETNAKSKLCEPDGTFLVPQLDLINRHECSLVFAADAGKLHDLLYGVENLRKRGNEDS